MYLDSAYIAKYYVNEPDSDAVRKLMRGATDVCSSQWALVEVTAVFHRHMRERWLTAAQGRATIDLFREHVEANVWNLIPVTSALLRRTCILIRDLPRNLWLRSGDAIHIATAIDAGETDIHTNDRHLLAAARYAGLRAKSVTN